MISDTLRHWPDLASSNARSIAELLVMTAPYRKRSHSPRHLAEFPEGWCDAGRYFGRRDTEMAVFRHWHGL
jgi:hypothetical protein